MKISPQNRFDACAIELSSGKPLRQSLFERPTLHVARDLIGKVLVRKIGKEKSSVIITETEAYIGEDDLACHARFGRTKRNAVMYEKGGAWYVYLIYGMYWMLNVVTEKENEPAAVLIRSGVLTSTGEVLRGPGILTKALKIDASLYGQSAISGALQIQDIGTQTRRIVKTARIGIDYAGEYKDKKWRFVLRRDDLARTAL
jgi:DNA-3-methyladenine glycosylase